MYQRYHLAHSWRESMAFNPKRDGGASGGETYKLE
jgi:hypothetical protein